MILFGLFFPLGKTEECQSHSGTNDDKVYKRDMLPVLEIPKDTIKITHTTVKGNQGCQSRGLGC